MICEKKSQKSKLAEQLIELSPTLFYHDLPLLMSLTVKELENYSNQFKLLGVN